MNKTYATALDYILQSAAEKKKGKVGGISTEELQKKESYLASTAEESNIKVLIDKYLKETFGVDDYEIEEMYRKLEYERYIRTTTKNFDKHFVITFKGLDWISSEIGGFSQERNDLINKRRSDKRMLHYTRALAIGSIALVVVEVLIHYHVI